MKIIRNEKLIKRNGKIANYAMIAALAALGGGMYLSLTRQDLVVFMVAALVLGFILTQVSTYMMNKFGPSPRPDERLDAALKGLPNEFTIYHYTAPASHLLVGPAGVWVLEPYHVVGRVTFTKNRWRNAGGGFFQSYLRFLGMGGLGRPDIEAEGDIEAVRKYLSRQMEESELPEIDPLLVFTNERVELDAKEAPVPAMLSKQIKDFMRQKAKEKKFPPLKLAQLKSLFGGEETKEEE